MRNIIGTGIALEFVGGLLGALGAMFFLLRTSAPITIAALSVMLVFGLVLRRAFSTIRPYLPRARKKSMRKCQAA